MGMSPGSPLEILDIALEYVTNPLLHCSLILCILWTWLSYAFTSLILVPNVNYTSTHTLWTRKILLFKWVYVQLKCTFQTVMVINIEFSENRADGVVQGEGI